MSARVVWQSDEFRIVRVDGWSVREPPIFVVEQTGEADAMGALSWRRYAGGPDTVQWDRLFAAIGKGLDK